MALSQSATLRSTRDSASSAMNMSMPALRAGPVAGDLRAENALLAEIVKGLQRRLAGVDALERENSEVSIASPACLWH